jgi:hypothetical protein
LIELHLKLFQLLIERQELGSWQQALTVVRPGQSVGVHPATGAVDHSGDDIQFTTMLLQMIVKVLMLISTLMVDVNNMLLVEFVLVLLIWMLDEMITVAILSLASSCKRKRNS